MEVLIQATQFLLSLSLLIVLHEFGHFIPARLFGTRVEKFYLFFDYKWSLVKKKIGDTEWGIGWIPLGGYVKIAGMIDESMDTEQMKGPAQPWEFRAKPAWQRLIIMLGGVTVNLILGFFIYAMMMWALGERTLPNDNLKDGVWVMSEIAEEIGFRNGDKILSVRGEEVPLFTSLTEEIIYGGEVMVLRDGQQVALTVPESVVGTLSERRTGPFFYPRVPFIINSVPDTSHNAGVIQPKDEILALAGRPVKYYDQAQDMLKEMAGALIELDIRRDGKRIGAQVKVNEDGMIGVRPLIMSFDELERTGQYEFVTEEYSFAESWPAGWRKTMDKLGSYVRQFKLILNPETGAYKGMGGFMAIGGLFSAEWDWVHFWEITALISLILAFMNLLPIPVLDGGHVMFLLYEMATGREPNQKILEYAQMIGFFLLIALLIYANGNDIYHWLKG
ncbi:MAG: RIP metalloprotease RseP [Flavobacteriales bacterium]|nr:RIP metalloprotease RseP [Flavobacteriales bacterium]